MQTHQVITLDLHSNIVDWCPTKGHYDKLVVGTYQLDEATQLRHGRIYAYQLLEGSPQLAVGSQVDLPGVFDVCWHPATREPLLGAALADGSVRLFIFDDQGVIMEVCSSSTRSCLASSVDFSKDRMGASYSSGEAEIFSYDEDSISSVHRWAAHSLEVWAFSYDKRNDRNICYTGGDDCCFKMWDPRQGCSHPIWNNSKEHQAGVCCIEPAECSDHIVCTGSYDEKARIWDVRRHASPLLSLATGGGVWRMKLRPDGENVLLAACMHAGFAILEFDTRAGTFIVKERYPQQVSLAYGCSWYSGPQQDTFLIGTVSFYDRLLHLWSTKI